MIRRALGHHNEVHGCLSIDVLRYWANTVILAVRRSPTINTTKLCPAHFSCPPNRDEPIPLHTVELGCWCAKHQQQIFKMHYQNMHQQHTHQATMAFEFCMRVLMSYVTPPCSTPEKKEHTRHTILPQLGNTLTRMILEYPICTTRPMLANVYPPTPFNGSKTPPQPRPDIRTAPRA